MDMHFLIGKLSRFLAALLTVLGAFLLPLARALRASLAAPCLAVPEKSLALAPRYTGLNPRRIKRLLPPIRDMSLERRSIMLSPGLAIIAAAVTLASRLGASPPPPPPRIGDVPGLFMRVGQAQPVSPRTMLLSGGRSQTTDFTATTIGRTSAFKDIVRVDCSYPQWEYGNHYKSGIAELFNTNPIWVRAYCVYPAGVFYPLTFNGRDRVEIDPGGLVRTDPLGIQLFTKTGTVGASATTTSVPCSDLLYFLNQTDNANLIRFTSGALSGTEVYITATSVDAVSALATFTVQTLSVAPAQGDTFTIYPVPQIKTYAWLDGGTYTVDVTGATLGNFKLTFNGEQTADIPIAATPPQLARAIAILSTVNGPDNVRVSGQTPTWTVRLRPTLPVNDQALTGQAGTSLTGIAAPTVTQQAYLPLGDQTKGGGTSAPYEGRVVGDTLTLNSAKHDHQRVRPISDVRPAEGRTRAGHRHPGRLDYHGNRQPRRHGQSGLRRDRAEQSLRAGQMQRRRQLLGGGHQHGGRLQRLPAV
jgi:hypothetical protein